MGLGDIEPGTVAFFMCDIQEKFRKHIKYFDDMTEVATRLVSRHGHWSMVSRLGIQPFRHTVFRHGYFCVTN